jgi:hypothetical protein
MLPITIFDFLAHYVDKIMFNIVSNKVERLLLEIKISTINLVGKPRDLHLAK